MARELTDEQKEIICACVMRPYLAIWADMGAGKTAITLHAIAEMLRLGFIRRAVVVAPRAVADSTWAQEAALWDDTKDLRVVVLRGVSSKRKAHAATPAEIYCIGRDGLAEKNAHRGCIASADLKARARSCEAGVPLGYLRALEDEYADAMQTFARKCPVVEIDAEQDAWHVLSQCQRAIAERRAELNDTWPRWKGGL